MESKTMNLNFSNKQKMIAFEAICYAFILLFVYTAGAKLMRIDTFKTVLIKYPIIGSQNTIIAYLVPSTELFISGLLIIPTTKKYGIMVSLILMSLFLGYIIYMFLSGSSLPCSCGGILAALSWQQHIWFNSIFLLLAIIALKIYKK